MLGSLRKIWPFKITLETMIDRHGDEVPKVQQNIMPDLAGPEPWIALGLAVFGFLLILGAQSSTEPRNRPLRPSND